MNPSEIGKVGAVGSEPALAYQASAATSNVQMPKQNKPVIEMPAEMASQFGGEIRLSFRVDGSNNDVTITVTDKDSGRVIRTIPFEEMKDLSIGELFQISK